MSLKTANYVWKQLTERNLCYVFTVATIFRAGKGNISLPEHSEVFMPLPHALSEQETKKIDK